MIYYVCHLGSFQVLFWCNRIKTWQSLERLMLNAASGVLQLKSAHADISPRALFIHFVMSALWWLFNLCSPMFICPFLSNIRTRASLNRKRRVVLDMCVDFFLHLKLPFRAQICCEAPEVCQMAALQKCLEGISKIHLWTFWRVHPFLKSPDEVIEYKTDIFFFLEPFGVFLFGPTKCRGGEWKWSGCQEQQIPHTGISKCLEPPNLWEEKIMVRILKLAQLHIFA